MASSTIVLRYTFTFEYFPKVEDRAIYIYILLGDVFGKVRLVAIKKDF
jgi:hypothetical protein